MAPRLRPLTAQILGSLLLLLLSSGTIWGQEVVVGTLEPATPIERSHQGPGVDRYSLPIEAPSYLWLAVAQNGLDVLVRRLDPEGQTIEERDVVRRPRGTEHVYLLVEEPGEHRIEVYVQGESEGSYRITIEQQRPLRPVDHIRVPQESAYDEARELLLVGEAEQAKDLFLSTIPTWQHVNDPAYEASTLDNIGFCYRRLEQGRQAVDYYRRALPLWRRAGMLVDEANTWINLGAAQHFLDDMDGAQESYERALELLEPTGDLRKTAIAFNNLARVHQELGRLTEARTLFERVLALRRQLGDPRGILRPLNNLGWVLTQLGEMDEALAVLYEALAMAKELGDLQIQTSASNNLGVAHDWSGEPLEALRHLHHALQLAREREVLAGQASAHRNLGDVYSNLGDMEQALRSFEQAEALHDQLERPADRAEALIQIGRIHLENGRPDRALAPLRQSVETLETLEQPFFLAAALEKLGRAEALDGRPDLGKAHLDRARLISHGIGDLRGESKVWLGQGALEERRNNLEAAGRFYARSAELSRRGGDRHTTIDALAAVARTARQSGDLDAAARHIVDALNLTESVRLRSGGELSRAAFLATRKGLYEFAIDLAVERGQESQAFRFYQLSRSRSLLDLVSGFGEPIGETSTARIDPGLIERERTLRRELSAAERRLAAARGPQRVRPTERQRIETEQAERVHLHAEVVGRIRQQSQREGERLDPQPLALEILQQEVLDDSTTLLAYALGDEHSFLWVITKTSFITRHLPPRATIAQAVQAYGQLLTLPAELAKAPSVAARQNLHNRLSNPRELEQAARNLSQLLLEPAADLLEAKQRLAIMADGPLQALPFGALPSPRAEPAGTPLILDHEVVHLPSASVVEFSRRERQTQKEPTKLLAIFADPVFGPGDPRLADSPQESTSQTATGRFWQELTLRGAPARLPHSAREAQRIVEGLPPEQVHLAMGFEASREAVLSAELHDFRIVHLATHGFLHEKYPQLSGLIFSLFDAEGKALDGHLHLQDIYGLDLAADLVVLSACETALGRDIPGEGLLGLTHGFLQAGTARVLASLWPVDDEATAHLMIQFYDALLDDELSAAAALRQAQIALWNSTESPWHHPYYWAGFVMNGEWR